METSNNPTLWIATDPLTRRVVLTSERMKHAEIGHPEMIGQDKAIKGTIEDPNVIYQSISYPSRDVYFKFGGHPQYPSLYLKVAVEHGVNPGDVRTAHLDDEFGGVDSGGLKYVKPHDK